MATDILALWNPDPTPLYMERAQQLTKLLEPLKLPDHLRHSFSLDSVCTLSKHLPKRNADNPALPAALEALEHFFD